MPSFFCNVAHSSSGAPRRFLARYYERGQAGVTEDDEAQLGEVAHHDLLG